MESMNFYLYFVTALIPLLIGFVWYHPKTFGNAWMKEADLTDEKMKGGNMLLTFGLTYVFGLLVSVVLGFTVIHQMHLYSVLAEEPGINDPNSEIGMYVSDFMAKYGNNFRTFKHGAFHGTLTGLFLALPVLAVNALFERKSWRYILINASFWVVSFALIGGILSAWM
ncbi:MAG: DUF1761 domain-containing protein [Haliscomenobacter sp.]|nr:DUF1761 domain-containing protein [Haliscomenobacter sp.]MBK8877838.1 DUF1761 domain-containing protein [Haliscomenobacter sp.]